MGHPGIYPATLAKRSRYKPARRARRAALQALLSHGYARSVGTKGEVWSRKATIPDDSFAWVRYYLSLSELISFKGSPDEAILFAETARLKAAIRHHSPTPKPEPAKPWSPF